MKQNVSMREPLCVALSLLCGCTCVNGTTVLDRPDGRTQDSGPETAVDAALNARDASAQDASVDAQVDLSTPSCVGRDDVGSFEGLVPLGRFRFPYVSAGIEPATGHSCPRLFLRAGVDPTFSGDHLEVEAFYTRGEPVMAGIRPGAIRVYIGDQVWSSDEGIEVDVQRADGLLDTSVPMDLWRASAEIHVRRAVVDIDAMIVDAEYCRNFPLCL